jgi:FkbM family methyltransferase
MIFLKKLNTSKIFKFRLNFLGTNFDFYVKSMADIGVINEIFIKGDYKYDFGNLNNIVDVGSNIGASAVFFAINNPNSKIYCFEPDPNNFELLKLNTKKFPCIKIYNKAISFEKGFIELNIGNSTSLSSSVYKRDILDKSVKIEALSLKDILEIEKIEKIDLLKMDIEGYEWDIFSKNKVEKIDNFVVEFHEDLNGHSVEEFEKIFENFKIERKFLHKSRYILIGRKI